MNRTELKSLFAKIPTTEAQWAIDTLNLRSDDNLSLYEYESVSHCLCKINDHAEIDNVLLLETELAEEKLIEIISKLRVRN